MFTYQSTSSITRRRSVRLSSIAEYSRLQPPVGVWTVRSSIGGDRPLSPPKRRSLGRPLPYQLADTTQATPEADCSFNLTILSGITHPFGWLCPTSGDLPTCYYLVCHFANASHWPRTYADLTQTYAERMQLHCLSVLLRLFCDVLRSVRSTGTFDLHDLSTPPAFTLS